MGSAAAILRTKLLSMPHDKHAPITASGPMNPVSVGVPCHDTVIAPASITPKPATTRAVSPSRNTSHPTSAVSTASRLSSSEAVEASVRCSPVRRSSGPKMPPNNTEIASQRH